MKLPYLLGTFGLAAVVILAGCGGGGTGRTTQDWRSQLFVGDLPNYEYVITRNNAFPGDSADECNSLEANNPGWCAFFNDGTVDFEVAPTERPYKIFVRRVDGGSPSISAAVGKQNGDNFERRNNIRLDGFNYIYLWEVNLDSARYDGSVITVRSRTAAPTGRAVWSGKR